MAQKFIIKHRRGTLDQWLSSGIIPYAGELVVEIDEVNNLHKLKIGDGVHSYSELAYLKAGDEIVSQVLTQTLPRVVNVELSVESWVEVTDMSDANVGCYKQAIDVSDIGNCCRLDLQPDVDMLAELKQLGITFVTENYNGTVFVYSISNKPLRTYEMQATVTEVNIASENERILGLPVGASTILSADGATGTDGKSPYEYAQEAGYLGTEEEFYEKLAEVGNSQWQATREIKTAVPMITQQTITIADKILNFTWGNGVALTVGEKYTVVWNDVAYVCTCFADGDGYPALGDETLIYATSGSYPFYISRQKYDTLWICKLARGEEVIEFSLSEGINGTVYNTIPEEYLPESLVNQISNLEARIAELESATATASE